MSFLRVTHGDMQVGTLRLNRSGVMDFEYFDSYLESGDPAISASLPITHKLHEGAIVERFFGNLLPEGEIREELSLRHRIDNNDDFGLLNKIGGDCAGALSLLPEETPESASNAQTFDELYVPFEDEYAFGQYIENVKGAAGAPYMGKVTRMSLAGVQRKTVIARFGGSTLYRCTGGASTHIVKIGSRLDQRGHEFFPGIVYNEYFCMKLAKAIKLPVAEVELLPYQTYRGADPLYVFATERFDRAVDTRSRKVIRLHQEDFCQALGRPRIHKYEANGGISLAEMFNFLSLRREITFPAISRGRFLEAVLFNLMVGNRDSHAKNYSLLRTGQRADLQPLYDVVCTEIYENVDQILPQRIGIAQRVEDIRYIDFANLAAQIDVKPVVITRSINKVAGALERKIPSLISDIQGESFATDLQPVAEKISGTIRRNIEHIRRIIPR
jgi:serine/threonine-protein kinase HipA